MDLLNQYEPVKIWRALTQNVLIPGQTNRCVTNLVLPRCPGCAISCIILFFGTYRCINSVEVQQYI